MRDRTEVFKLLYVKHKIPAVENCSSKALGIYNAMKNAILHENLGMTYDEVQNLIKYQLQQP